MVVMDFPFDEIKEDNISYRTFYEDVESSELVWHRDREDRIVEVIGVTNWKFQMDNDLPKVMETKFFIPKNIYHRVIKGTGDLRVKITKL